MAAIMDECETGPDLVVHAAGILDGIGSFLDVSEELYDSVLDVNLKGTFFVNQIAAKSMIDSKVTHGSIVNVSSEAGEWLID